LVQAKLRAQAATLDAFRLPGESLRRLALKVRAGDPSNLEAQGARQYWTQLFGKEFRRDPDLGGINGLLNYGYTVLRSAAARAIVGAGLHPTLGLHHGNAFNACALADDVMEPFRPFIDAVVKGCSADEVAPEVSPARKRLLALALYRNVFRGRHDTDDYHARTCQSLVDVYAGHRRSLELPGLPPAGACAAPRRHVESRDMARRKRAAPSEPLSGYRLMWVMVMFDLPVDTEEAQGGARFPRALKDLGFAMAQHSVYLRCRQSRRLRSLHRTHPGTAARGRSRVFIA
jgi:hypothetical protein